MSRLIWIYAVCKSLLLSTVAVQELRVRFQASETGLNSHPSAPRFSKAVLLLQLFFVRPSAFVLSLFVPHFYLAGALGRLRDCCIYCVVFSLFS